MPKQSKQEKYILEFRKINQPQLVVTAHLANKIYNSVVFH